MDYLDIDGDNSTFMSSSDSMNLSNCSEVLWAGLYWAGRINNSVANYSTRNRAKIKLNSGSYLTLTADELIDVPSLSTHPSYYCYKNITSIVQGAGTKGRFTVADIVTQTGSSNLWGSWSIVVVYKNVFQSMRNLTVFDGFANVGSGNSLDIPISGFLTPLSGPVSFELGIISYEGDRGSTGDQLQFNGAGTFVNVSDALHPSNDFFNSTVSYDAVITPFRNPNYNNTLALDASIFIPNNTTFNYLGNNVSNATIRVTTSSENIMTRVVTSSIDIFEPDLRADVRIRDINGGNVNPGDVLEYTVVGKNIGSDLSINTYMVDTLDPRTTFVPGSISISYGPNLGNKTDVVTDDQAEYISSSRAIRARVGTGASGSTGGQMQASGTGADSTVLKFRVTVLNDCPAFLCNPSISNSAYIYGTGNISGNQYNNGGVSDSYNSQGCPLTASNALLISVASCPPFAITNNTVCIGQTLNLGATSSSSIATYSWSGPNGFTSTLSNPTISNVSAASAGTYTLTIAFPSLGGCSITVSKTITIQSPPVLNLVNLTNVTCFGLNNGSIQVSTTGNSPFTYLWSNNATSTTISNLAPNNYTVTATDNLGCTATQSYTITQPTILTASASVTSNYNGRDISCNGAADGSALVTFSGGTAPYSISWSNSATTAAISNLGPGTYTATITDANGCIKTASVTLTQPTVVVLSDSHVDINCFGQSTGSIDLSVSGGTPGYLYSWTNTATTEDLTSLPSGIYTVTVNDLNNCTKTRTITLTQPAAPLALTMSVTNVACFGNSTGAVNLSVSGGTGPYSYLWSNNASTQDLSNLTAGNYSVTVTDNKGCVQTLSTPVTQPAGPLTSTLSATNIACFGNATGAIDLTPAGGTPPYTYLWSNTSTTQDLSGRTPGTYNVTIKDANNCTATNTATLTQPTAALNATATSINPSCFGTTNGSVDVTVSGGTAPYFYAWSNSTTTQDLPAVGAGTYNLVITDSQGCTFNIQRTLGQPTPTGIGLNPTAVLCFGENTGAINLTVIGGTAPYSYLWSTSATTQNISNLSAGTYSVTVTDAQSCQINGNATVTQPTAPLFISETHLDALCVGAQQGSIDLTVTGGTGIYSYQWNNSATTEDVTNLVAGTYSVTVTDENNCQANRSVTILDPSNTMVLSETHTNVTCFGADNGTINLNVTGGAGNYTYLWNNTSTTQDLSNLAAGNYFVTVTDANTCQSFIATTITSPLAPLAVTGFRTDMRCFDEASGAFTLTTTGGTQPYAYTWNTGATTEDLTDLDQGDYTLLVRDSNNCTTTYSATIYEPLDLVIGRAITVVSCNGGSDGAINMTPAGGITPYTYQWSNGATTQDISGLSAGTYRVVLRDFNNCIDSLDITVVEPTVIGLFEIHSDVSCFGGSNGSIFVAANGGNLNFNYAWSNASTSNVLNNLVAGTYTVTVTDSKNCTNTFSIPITQPTAPFTLTASMTAVLCHGDSTGTATVTASGGTPNYTYLWNNTTTQAIATNLLQGLYTVVVKDANNCEKSISIQVTQPTLLTTQTDSLDVLCYGDSTGRVRTIPQGGVGNYTYSWTSSTHPIVTTIMPSNLSIVNNLPAGIYTVEVRDGNQCLVIDSTVINQPDTALAISLTQIDNLCFGDSLASIDVTTTGGTAPYIFNWSNNETTEDIDSLAVGTYFLTVKDDNNCLATINTTIVSPTQLAETNVITNVNCFGENNGAIDLSITGGVSPYTYLWNTSDTTQDIDSLIAGIYTVEVLDSNNCQAIFSITVTEPPLLTLALTQVNVACFGASTASINLTVSGGTTPYNYAWSNNQITEDISGLPIGTYEVIVVDQHNCTDSISTTITQPQAPIALTEMHLDILCHAASTGAIDVEVTGGTPSLISGYTYNWNNGFAFTQDLTSIPVGTYEVIVRDSLNCVDSIEVTLTQPQAPIDIQYVVQNVLCFGDSTGHITATISGGTSPYTFLWNTNDSVSLYIDSLPIGTYSLTVTDTNNCVYAENVNVTQPVAPLFATYTAIQPQCFGYSNGQLIANPTGGTAPYTFVWSNGDTNQTNDSIPKGNYQLTVTDANGCSFDTLCILTEPPLLGVSFDADIIVGCSPLQVTFTNTSETNNACQWQFGDGNTYTSCDSVVNIYQDGGIYDVTLTVTDINGCTNFATYDDFITVYQSPTAGILADPTYLFAGNDQTNITNQSTGAEFYIWNMGDTPVNHFYFEPGNYTYTANLSDTFMITLIVISSDNCPDTAYQQIIFDNDPFYYVPNTFIPDGDGVNDVWNVVFSSPEDVKKYTMQIFDRWGELVFETTNIYQGWDGTYRNSQCQDGTYVWKLTFSWDDYRIFQKLGHVNLLR
jgi:gliding motility-associated-like protein/uncharacterized repeat protein (TIGR01451 family)